MASNQADRPQSSSEFGKMKRNVANSLTYVDTLNLATILNFSRALTDQLESTRAPGFLLLRILEQHQILGEGKVDELVEALREVHNEMAVQHVQKYKQTAAIQIPRQASESSLASEDSGIAASGGQHLLSLSELDLDDEPPQAFEAFCNHCNQIISWRSAASEHASHNNEIIAGENLTSEVLKRKEEINTDLDSVTETMKTTQEAINNEEMGHGELSNMVEEVERLAREFQGKVETRKNELIYHLSRSDAERSDEHEDYKKEVTDMLLLCDNLKRELDGPGDSGRRDRESETYVSHLIYLNDMKKKITVKRHSVNAKLKDVQEHRSRMFLTQTPNDGNFAELIESTLFGIVWVLTDQLVMVFDERRRFGYVEIKCFEGANAEIESWNKRIESSKYDGRVAVSAIEYYNGSHPHLLLAAGKTVYMLQLSYDGTRYDGIIDTKSYELKMAPDAYITTISAHEQGSHHRDKFVLANNVSLNLFQYNGLCELDREIKCSALVSSIVSVSCVDDTVAIVDNLSKNVLILQSDGTVTSLIDTLTPSICDSGAIPWMVLWTGAVWLILWVPDTDNSLKWWVSSHNEDGGDVRLYSGEFSRMSFPISISRNIYGIVVSFSDSSIHKFEQT